MGNPDDSDMADPIPLEAFFGEDMQVNPVTKDLLLQADVILGLDVMSQREYVIFGKARLKRIADTGQGEDLRILRVSLDEATDDLDKLCGLVMLLRGRFDYGKDLGEPIRPLRFCGALPGPGVAATIPAFPSS